MHYEEFLKTFYKAMKVVISSNVADPFDLASTWRAPRRHLGTQGAHIFEHLRYFNAQTFGHSGTQGNWALEMHLYFNCFLGQTDFT